MRPNHKIRPFAGLSGNREAVGDLFGGLDRDFQAQIGFELLDDWLESTPTLVVHPDQELTIDPCKHVYRDQTEGRQCPQQPIHEGAEKTVLQLPGNYLTRTPSR